MNLVFSFLSFMSMCVMANDPIFLSQDRLSVSESNVLIQRTEITPDKVKIKMPINFSERYCTGYETATRHVPCPTHNTSSGGGHRPTSGSSNPRPHHGNPGRPPRPGTSPHRPHLKCTETYRYCVGHSYRHYVDERTFTLKFKGDATEFNGDEIYQLIGDEQSEGVAVFTLKPINEMANKRKIVQHLRKRVVVK